jgi:predicted hydrolase (HD superfamily)
MKEFKIKLEMNKIFQEMRIFDLYETVKKMFIEKNPIGHNWEHIQRVIINAVQIGLAEEADMHIVIPAVILHDIGYLSHPGEPRKHSIYGAEECFSLLTSWTMEQREQISSCILKHKGKFPGFKQGEPETLEEKVVCDADQLDKFGWIGLIQMMRVYMEYVAVGDETFKTMQGLVTGMRAQKLMTIYTNSGKQMAKNRSKPDFNQIASLFEKELQHYEFWNKTKI